jgi:hypothetical protein
MNHPTSVRHRTNRRRQAPIKPAADVLEVLESRVLLTPTPFLAFAVQPSNAIAGHGLSFTVDVMTTVRNRPRPVIDTAYTGGFTGVPNGPQPGFDVAFNFEEVEEQNLPINSWGVLINHGVGKVLANFLALDTAGTYTMTITAFALPGTSIPGVPGSVTSNPFTISPFTSTDHLVFVNPLIATAGIPTSVTVAVEDQFGNIDTKVSNVPVDLFIPVSISTAVLTNGEATFNNVVFAAPGQDVLLAFDFGPTWFPIADGVVTVLPPPTGG